MRPPKGKPVNLASQLTDEENAREIASRLEAENPLWIVIFGDYSQQFVCFPRFEAPSGTMLIAPYPPALPDRMRHIEESAAKAQLNALFPPKSRWVAV